MKVWLQNPFDNLPLEGYRKMRYWMMAEAFVRAGHDVTLWTASFNHGTKAPRRIAGAPDGFALRLYAAPPYARNVSFARIRSHRAAAAAWERDAVAALSTSGAPDLIVTSSPTLSGAEAALRLGKRMGAKVVVDIQDDWPGTFERLAPRGLRGFFRLALAPLRRRARTIYRAADLVTGVCDRYRTLCGRADYFRAYLGIEGGAAVPPRPADGNVRLVYAGNLGRSYDLGTVFKGLSILREEGMSVTLDVAGKSDGALPAEGDVVCRGYLGERDLRTLLATCDIGIVPMSDDSCVGVPNKFADYAEAGLCILSSLGGESAALLAQSGAGVTYRAGDPKSFAAAVRDLAGRRAACGRAARELYERTFGATAIYDGYVRRLEDLACAR